MGTGRNIVGIMMLLTLPTRTMSLKSSLASQGNTQRPSLQPRRVKQRKEKQRPRERRLLQKERLLLRKERLLLLRRKLHLQKSREMCDSSSSSSSSKGRSQSRCHPIAVSLITPSLGEYLLRFSCV